jgi:heptosyltransferase-2
MSFKIKFEKFLDKVVFKTLCILAGLIKIPKTFKKDKVKKILFVKFWALGDSIVLLPTIKAMRKEFPDAQIDVLSHEYQRNGMVFAGQPFIDNVIEFGLFNILKLFRKYDFVIDGEPFLNVSALIAFLSGKYRVGFSHGVRSKTYHATSVFRKDQHMVQNYLDLARATGIKCDADKLIPFIISKEEQKTASEFLKKQGIVSKDFVVSIASGVGESVKYRMWPLEKFGKLVHELVTKHDAKVMFTDSKSNKAQYNKIKEASGVSLIDATGLDIKARIELIRRSNVFIGNDSGLMHVAAAEGTPTVGLFGPNTPVLWGPYGKNNISVWKPKKGCPFIDNTDPDLTPTDLTLDQQTVMDAITVNDVLAAINKVSRR